MVSGEILDISSVKDSSGHHPTSLFGSYDLKTLWGVSPYMKLSKYSGENVSSLGASMNDSDDSEEEEVADAVAERSPKTKPSNSGLGSSAEATKTTSRPIVQRQK